MDEAIHSSPAVLEVAVVGVPDSIYGESVIAFVVLREGHVSGEQELKDHTSKRLADIKVPEKILFLKTLPKGITGKVQRRALKEVALEAVA